MFRKLIPLVLLILILSGCIPGSELEVGMEKSTGSEKPLSMTKPTVETTTPTPTSEPAPEIPAPTATSEWSQYWTAVQDPYHDFRFAVPCFWLSVFPSDDPSGNGAFSYPVKNYPDEYVLNFPRSNIPADAGAVKIDMTFLSAAEMRNLPPGTSQLDFVTALYQDDSETKLISTQEMQINGQSALFVTIESNFGQGNFYLFTATDDLFLLFGVASEQIDHPDVLGILNSISLDPQIAVNISENKPAPPPVGLAAPCIPGYEQAVVPTVDIPESNTSCGLSSFVELEPLVSAVEQNLVNRNYGSLQYDNYINDPFIVGYWQSEGVTLTPNEAASLFANSLLPPTDHEMTFTSDQSLFPPLDGIPLENMFGPNVKVARIVYTEGWGEDGNGTAFLYFAQDQCGGYYWHGLVYK